jgi:hypothetical protein
MAVDYTVIQPVRQRFGDPQFPDTTDLEFPVELEAPFVGYAKEFPFSCPNVDSSQMAVLQLESLGLSARGRGTEEYHRSNILMINGTDVPGGLTPGAMTYMEADDLWMPYWKAHCLLVPAGVLKEESILYVESVKFSTGPGISYDNFIIDNVVLFFKTRTSGPVIGDFGPGG